MSDTPLAGRVAVVSGGGRGLGRSFCLALARHGAKVVVNNRIRVTDADGLGPADHVASEITAAGGEAAAEHSDAADPAAGEAIVAAALERPHPDDRRRHAVRGPRADGPGPGGAGADRAGQPAVPLMSWGPLLVNLAVTAGLVAALMLATFAYAMRTRVHAIMDTIWPLGFVLITLVSFLLSAGSGVAGRRVLVLVLTAVWGLLACSHWLGLVLVASPVYMTNMLVRRTGKRLLEKHMVRSKGGGVRRVRSAYQRLHPLAAALRGWTGAAVSH